MHIYLFSSFVRFRSRRPDLTLPLSLTQVSFEEIWREQMPFGFVADQARRQGF